MTLLLRDAEDLHGVPDGAFDAVVSNLVLHIVPDPLRMTREAHRVMRPGALAYFSVLCAYEQSAIFSACKLLLKKYGYTPPNTRSIFHLGQDAALESVFDPEQFEVVCIDTVNIVMEPCEVSLAWHSLQNFAEFVDTLSEPDRQALAKEHAAMLDDFRSKRRPFDFNMKAIFVKKL